jgi:hypothetical protein
LKNKNANQSSFKSFFAQASADGMPGATAPFGFFDPIGFADKADENTLKRYREAEITHGRVGMLAVIGFLVGEGVAGNSFLFDGSIKGPAISHLAQLPSAVGFLAVGIAKVELDRAQYGWQPPRDAGDVGMLRDDYSPGDINFDPLNLKPTDPAKLASIQTKEINNGRLAMLAAAGFMAQELVDGKGILEHLAQDGFALPAWGS